MKDALKQFVTLRSGLVAEKAELETRLSEINRALGSAEVSVAAAAAAPVRRGRGRPASSVKADPAPKAAKGVRRGRGRSSDGTSLRDVVISVLKSQKTLGRQDLLKAVETSGYKFSAKDPLNSLSTLIYSNKKVFKAKEGQISLVNP